MRLALGNGGGKRPVVHERRHFRKLLLHAEKAVAKGGERVVHRRGGAGAHEAPGDVGAQLRQIAGEKRGRVAERAQIFARFLAHIVAAAALAQEPERVVAGPGEKGRRILQLHERDGER